MLHTFAVYVEDKPGVLNRIASLFRRRAFNIDSLTVGHTETEGVSRMTIVCDADETSARRIEANVYKLVNVLRVDDLSQLSSVDRELAMVKVSATSENRAQVMQLADVFRARVVDVSPSRSSSRRPAPRRRSSGCSTCCGRTACSRWCARAASPWRAAPVRPPPCVTASPAR